MHKELLKQVVSIVDIKYVICDLVIVGHIESAFPMSEADKAVPDLHPD